MIEARDTGRPRPPAAGGGRSRRGPGPKLLIGAAVLVVVLVAAVAAVLLAGGDDEKSAADAPSNGARLLPVAYTPDYDGQGLGKIAKRSADARPFTADEVFGADARTLKGGGYTYALKGSQVSGDCKAATWGARLQGELAKYGCTQVGRGAYVSADGRYIGQFAVLNMADQAGVQQILRTLDPATGAGFVLPLQAAGAPAFAKGFSAAYARTFGHYAVVSWVQRAGGANPANLNEAIKASLPIENPADFVWARLQMAAR
ncbi:hypothetical protein [Actinomadura parmotrematis]|uniref:Uncharacterized protein n=1 Tax=Actinomadura parmotrematis TaxID=2864039 RepID=A0ABS7FL47_9ACTN|nr:hypothetical protein [Actinomadura parmotrematis]MBW8481084.1 hypothetical protein [Actinomadura parmotrematis]